MKLILKIPAIIIFLITIQYRVQSQDLVRLIAVEICNCVDTIENMDSLEAKIDRCFPESFETVMNLLDEEIQERLDEAKLEEIIDGVYNNLLNYCPKIKIFILNEKEKTYYKMSDSEKAKEYYFSGNKAFEAGDYKTAQKQYQKAIKEDPGWVLPYDNLGLTYRKSDKYKKAVKCFEKSLKIFPEGWIALQNQAAAYTFLNNYIYAMNNYDMLINLYPDNPEGYFGMARILVLIKDYENALVYAFRSHKMYLENKSEHSKDSEQLLSMIYERLKEQNKESMFFDKAKQFGVNIILNQIP